MPLPNAIQRSRGEEGVPRGRTSVLTRALWCSGRSPAKPSFTAESDTPPANLVLEVALASHDHRDPGGVRRSDDVSVLQGASRLDGRRHACPDPFLEAVWKGEELSLIH